MIAIFVLIIQGILFLGHYFVYKTVVRFLGITDGTYVLWTKIIFGVLSVSFMLVSLITYKYYGPIGRGVYMAAAVWLGTLYWLFFASIVVWVLYGLAKLLVPGRDISLVAIGVLVLALLTSAYGVWNSYQTKIRYATIKIDNLPEQWKGRKAVLVADTHMGNIRNVTFSEKAAKLIEAQSVDIVLLPGDFYDGPPTDYVATARPFGAIKSKFGTYLAPGNHEEFGDSTPLLTALSEAGVHVLNDQMEVVDGLQIIGVGYGSTTNPEKQKDILAKLSINPSAASILIKHAPTHIEVAEVAGIALQVSGHTHLGQVYPMKYLTKLIYGKFFYGHNKLNTTQVYTTSGIGTWGPPQRVGTNSEIVVITLE